MCCVAVGPDSCCRWEESDLSLMQVNLVVNGFVRYSRNRQYISRVCSFCVALMFIEMKLVRVSHVQEKGDLEKWLGLGRGFHN